MKRRRVVVLGSLAAFALGGCGSPPTDKPQVTVPVQQPGPVVPPPVSQASPMPEPGKQSQTIQVETLAKGTESDVGQPGYQVIRSKGELDSLIEQAGIDESVPEVHWQDEMVVAVFAGERPGTVEVISIADEDGERLVKVSHKGANGEKANRAFHLVVMPKTSDEIVVRGLPDRVATQPNPAASPGGSDAANDQNVVKLIAAGPQSGVKQPVNVVIRTPDELKAVWDVHAAGLAQPMAPPEIDLNTRMIVGIFVGQSSQIGGIELQAVTPTQQGIVVSGRAMQGNGQNASPFVMISLPKVNAPVDVQIQGAPQAQTLGNPQTQPQQPQAPQQPGFGQPVQGGVQTPGFGQPIGNSPGLGAPYLGGPNAQPVFPPRGSLITGGGTGGLLGQGGYVPGY